MSEMIKKVETFIQRLHDLEYIITPEAKTIEYVSKSGKSDRSMLSDDLSRSILTYEELEADDNTKRDYARICYLWINRAFSCSVVREGPGLARKLKECRERNVQLERDNEVLSEKYLNLKMTHDDFSSRLNILDENDLEDER